MPKPRTGAKKTAQIPFSRKLALHQWALSLFGVQRFEDLALHLRDEGLEGFDENNISRFHHALLTHFPDLPKLPPALLLEYDQNIFRHTAALN
jgi:hypothetical protein